MSSRSWRNNNNLLMDVARNAAGIPVIAYGRNPDVDTAAEDLYDGGGDFPYASAAETLEIVSSSTADDGDPIGTGARTATVEGLDGSYNPLSQTVTLDGTTAVILTGGDYLRVFSIKVNTAGSGGTNTGTLTLRVSSGGATRAIVLPTAGRSEIAVYTIPAGKAGYILGFDAQILLDFPTSPVCQVGLLTKDFGGIWLTRHSITLSDVTEISMHQPFPIPLRVPEKSDVRLRAIDNDVADTVLSGSIHMAVLEE